jgi:DnaJ family protein C protein 2
MDKSTSNSLIVYVSFEAWLKSVLEGNHGRVETTINYRNKDEEEDFSSYEFEDDILYLRSLDPKHWKEQDHYAVLGIKNLRHRANEDVIKRACEFVKNLRINVLVRYL